ncbi:MAG: hypothetical protein AAFQ61_02990 [Cyanobacteria bacterium J06626_23]
MDTHQLLAHQVELSGEVGGTLHIEPTDNPRAGEPAVTWFALVKAGGEPVPLAACDCELVVYALPRQPDDSPLSQPDLAPLSAEGFKAIPSAEITFPAVGEYELLLTGSAIGEPVFEPFELSYEVLVARGSQATIDAEPVSETAEQVEDAVAVAQPSETVAVQPVVEENAGLGSTFWLSGLFAFGLIVGGIVYLVTRGKGGQ